MSEHKKRIYEGELIGTSEITVEALSLFQSQFWKLAGMQELSPLTLTKIDTEQYRAMGVVRLDPLIVDPTFVREEDLDVALNGVPNSIAAALVGLAEYAKGELIHYYKSKSPTITRYEFREFSDKINEIRTTHHALVFNNPKPAIFDLSPAGRIIARKNK